MEEEIFREYVSGEGRKVFNMILRMVRNREDAEDLFQEVYMAFYENIDRVNEKAQKSYLYRIAYNKTLNKISSRKREMKIKDIHWSHAISEAECDPEPEAEERNRLIRECLGLLKPKEALLIELQFYQGKSYKEISEVTGYSTGSVDSRLVRAKKKLHDILESRGINKLQENQQEVVI
jgi:RNA polymerase sigma-70 factor (ECF subfamily)